MCGAEAVGGDEGSGDQDTADDGGAHAEGQCSDDVGPGGEDVGALEDGGEGRADHPAAVLVGDGPHDPDGDDCLGELVLRPSTRQDAATSAKAVSVTVGVVGVVTVEHSIETVCVPAVTAAAAVTERASAVTAAVTVA
jgi:hypothetical protein